MSKNNKNNPPQLAGVIDNILKTETYENAMKILESMPRPLVIPTIEAEAVDRHARCILDTAKTVAPLAAAQGMDPETMLLVMLSVMVADCVQAARASGIDTQRVAERAHAILCGRHEEDEDDEDEDDEERRLDFAGIVGTATDKEFN